MEGEGCVDMLHDIAKVEISGANFKCPTNLELLDPMEEKKILKGTLLYGKNGSGKSTIARGFRTLSGESSPAICGIKALDKAGQPVNLMEDEKNHIFIFDEDFVDKNVKLHEDHLDTIIMLGEQADLTEQINVAESERDAAKESFEKQRDIYAQYSDPLNKMSPKYYLDKLKAALQGDGNWAGRDKRIRGLRQNTGVRDDTYVRFENIVPSKSRDELLVDFNVAEIELANAKAGLSVINQQVPALPKGYDSYADADVQQLLLEVIERPSLSEREEYLLGLVQQGKSYELMQRAEMLEDPSTEFCPYCCQVLTSAYKEDLVLSIKRVLSKTVENHQLALREQIRGETPIDLSPFEKLEAFSACVGLIKQIDTEVRANNDLLQQKIDDPYLPIKANLSHIQEVILSLNQNLSTLEEQRKDHNRQAKSTEPIIERLNTINDEITHYDIKDLAQQYNHQLKECEAAKGLYDELKKTFAEKEDRVKTLEARRSNIILALDAINASMKYIFFAEDRLKIVCVDGNYKLLSNGHNVRPCDISVGERNIIGLCYFFASILQGQEKENAHKSEYLLVIDDPISSYDIENKVGILSFLKYMLSTFLEGNVNTKVLVMTHDLMAFYDIHKIFEEIMETCKAMGYPHPPKFNRFELRDNALHQFQYRKRQEYTELIRIIYSYGLGNADEQGLVIGNIMRQVLEAFSTFEFKEGIESVSVEDRILSSMNNKLYETYFKNLMYRLVLHGGSHREEQVKSMNDLNFFEVISDTEKKRTARDILCFIYLLNSPHLISHLKDIDDQANNTLKAWCQDIQTRSALV